MKLSSPPTRYAFTSVIAAAMKYGPTRVSRIAYELDMPVETCRYYLKRFHNMGFRFFPVVDYWALGLQPCILFVRFSKNLDPQKRENILRWLDTVYTIYRASLESEIEFFLKLVPPKGETNTMEKMMYMLLESGVVESFELSEVVGGYYRPEWIKAYDFAKDGWGDEIDIEIPKIPYLNGGDKHFDLSDLLIISELEVDPTVKMLKISQTYGVSPQLISYHREKHVEGCRLINGYVPIRRVKHEELAIHIIRYLNSVRLKHVRYIHQVYHLNHAAILRLHTPLDYEPDPAYPDYHIKSMSVRIFTIPTEHFVGDGWRRVDTFVQELEKILKKVEGLET
jgi:DNA-binding Lrp family transcriptional regulator